MDRRFDSDPSHHLLSVNGSIHVDKYSMDADSFIHYKIHIEERDREHEEIFKLLRIATTMVTSGDTSKLRNTLITMVTCITSHFMHEKLYMEKIEYPYIHHHLLIHRRILEQVEDLLSKFEAQYLYEPFGRLAAKNILNDFDYMMTHHVDHDDRQYAEFAINR